MTASDDRSTPPQGHRDGAAVDPPARSAASEVSFFRALARWVRRAAGLKSLVVILVSVLGAGAVAQAWQAGLARRGELAAEHAENVAGRAAVAADVRALDVRVGRLEASLGYIERVVYQVALAQGVRNVPPPPSTAAAEPPPKENP